MEKHGNLVPLFEKAKAGDTEARKRLTDHYLMLHLIPKDNRQAASEILGRKLTTCRNINSFRANSGTAIKEAKLDREKI